MIFANQPLVESHPRLLNTVPAFKTKGIMAPFWGKSNEATMSQHSDTNKRTQILVNDMERAAMSDDVLELAKQDATEAGTDELLKLLLKMLSTQTTKYYNTKSV